MKWRISLRPRSGCRVLLRQEEAPPRERAQQREQYDGCLTTGAPADAGEVHGNRHSKGSRVPGCKGYAGMNPASVVSFATEAEAQQAGYHKAKECS